MKRRKILLPNYSQAPAEGDQGGGSGQLPAGVAPGSAAAQAHEAGQQQQAPEGEKPKGFVPVGELAQERQKRHELEAQLAAAKTAADQQLEQFKKALGLSEGQTPEQLQSAAQQAQQTAKAAQTQLSVYKLAKGAGANADALLDSASFLSSLSNIDPTDESAVTAAITAAVERNKSLAAQRVSPGGARDAAQGGGGGTEKPGISDLIRAAAGK